MRRSVAPALALAAVLALVGCTAENEPAPMPTPTAEPSPTPFRTAAPSGDGAFVIGTLLSTSGDVSSPAAAQIAAVEVAVRELNDAGGVLGAPVTVVHRNAGAPADGVLAGAFADLVERGVDLVVGPADTAQLEELIPLATEAGVAVISPTATATSLRAKDVGGVFSRTAPAEDLLGAALAQAVTDAGATSIAILATDDAYGAAVSDAASAALEALELDVTTVAVTANTLADAAAQAAAVTPDAVVVATSSGLRGETPALLEELLDAGVTADQLWLGSAAARSYSSDLDSGALEGARGLREGAEVTEEFRARLALADPSLESVRFAPEAYDAVLLAAVAATVLEDEGGLSLATGMPQVAHEGPPCSSFGECLNWLETEDEVDVQGQSGPLRMTVDGDLIEADYGLFTYTSENRPMRDGTLQVRR